MFTKLNPTQFLPALDTGCCLPGCCGTGDDEDCC